MNLLLDTHVFLWWLASPGRLSDRAHSAIEDSTNIVFVSAATAWEIEIKSALGKLRWASDLPEQLLSNDFQELPVQIAHTQELRRLPNLHRDPFDRILVAQAKAARLVVVTADPQVLQYPGTFLRAI